MKNITNYNVKNIGQKIMIKLKKKKQNIMRITKKKYEKNNKNIEMKIVIKLMNKRENIITKIRKNFQKR